MEQLAIPKPKRLRIFRKEWPLYLFLAPALAVTIVFAYLPMLTNVIAFMDYKFTNGWMGLGSPFVGFKNFVALFNDKEFPPLIWRTFYYSVLRLVLGHPAPFILALLINEARSRVLKRTVQTIYYLPHFVSWTVIASLTYWFLTTDIEGLINNVRQMMGASERIIFMKYPQNFPWVLVITGMIKETGWGTIIYLAAISAVDAQLYEAAKIDGAGRWGQFKHVTFPSILPTTVILLVFSFGSLFASNFDQVFNLQNDIIRYDTNTISVYSYWKGVWAGRYSLATAAGLFQGAINATLLLSVNWLGRKVSGHGFF
jgi:putative aldouronate transport system permease protein